MAIWVIKDGQHEGPYDEGDVRELIYEGTYGDDDPAITDGQYDWTTLGQVLGREASASTPSFQTIDELPPYVPSATPAVPGPPEPQPALPPPMPAAAINSATQSKPTPVTIVDFQMPFGSMVLFMVKWVVASIPAFLILGAIAAFFWIGCAVFLAMLLHR